MVWRIIVKGMEHEKERSSFHAFSPHLLLINDPLEWMSGTGRYVFGLQPGDVLFEPTLGEDP